TSSEPVEPGDVVSIDAATTTSSVVKKSYNSYDDRAIGVVSTNPGLILGLKDGDVQLGGQSSVYSETASPNKPAVALTGRVPVKISDENGEVQPGDFLTSSLLLPGYAMKATRSGTILGRALGNFNTDSSTTTVNVSGRTLRTGWVM